MPGTDELCLRDCLQSDDVVNQLREIVGNSYNSLEQNSHNLLSYIERSTSPMSTNVRGRTFNVSTEQNTSEQFRQNCGPLPPGDATRQIRGYVTYRTKNKAICFCEEVLEQSPLIGRGLLQEQIDIAKTGFLKENNRHLYGDGTGTIALISRISGKTIEANVQQGFGYFGVRNLPRKKYVDIVSSDGLEVIQAGLRVVKQNNVAKLATFDREVSSLVYPGCRIVPMNSLNKVFKGLEYITANVGNYFGIPLSQYPTMHSIIVNGNNQPLNPTVLDDLFYKMETRQFSSNVRVSKANSVFFMHPSQKYALRQYAEEKLIWNAPGHNNSYDPMFPHADSDIRISDYKIVTDPDCPPDTVYLIPKGVVQIAELTKFAPKRINGNIINNLPSVVSQLGSCSNGQEIINSASWEDNVVMYFEQRREYFAPEKWAIGKIECLSVCADFSFDF